MQGVIIKDSDLFKILVCDCGMQNLKTRKCYISDFEFDDKYMTTFDTRPSFDKLLHRKTTEMNTKAFI